MPRFGSLTVLGEDVRCTRSRDYHYTDYIYTFTHENSLLRINVAYPNNQLDDDFFIKYASSVVLHSKFGRNNIKHILTKSELLRSLYE